MESDNGTALVAQPQSIGLVIPVATGQEWKTAWQKYQDAKKFLVDRSNDVLTIGKGEKKREFLKKSYWRKVHNLFALRVWKVDESIVRDAPCTPNICPEDCGGGHFEVFAVYRAQAANGAFADGDGSCIDNEKWLGVVAARKATPRQLDAIFKALKTRASNKPPVAGAIPAITGGRTASIEELTMQEASALMDWMFGKVEEPTPPAAEKPVRNSHHNVRGQAHTRAYNRAVSNLVGGGEVSADELIHDAYDYDDGPPSETIDAEYTVVQSVHNPLLEDPMDAETLKKIYDAARKAGITAASDLNRYASDFTEGKFTTPKEMPKAIGVLLLQALETDAATPTVS